ncbi:hypothetical protein [Paenibacillus sp. W2I17]|nr:hypothetical protein [Paenibacillus sp. W2I17]MDQ0656488.1 hypothetical protein [Paenibacillus sp. W2I17]
MYKGGIEHEGIRRHVILASLSEKNTYKRSFDLITGENVISEALNRL